jgi:MYXO-CTERM domain-containing protein
MACSNEKPELACSRDATGCLVNDRPLFWPTSCVSFGVQKDGSRSDGISYDTMRSVVDSAFQTWISADCGGVMPSVAIENYGAIDCNEREYNSDQANANVFMFRDADWPYENQQDTLALTTITFNVDTGEIYDADVEVNSFDYNLTIDDTVVDADLPSIITHEVGHFLGLSHSDVRSATMRPGYHPGDIGLRTLDADDVAGICALYGEEAAARPAECEPRHGFSRDCAVAETGCCALRGTEPKSNGPLALLLAGLGLVVMRRRIRRRS